MKVKLLSRVQLSVTPWTAAYQAPSSMVFSRQEYWSGVPLLLCNEPQMYSKLFPLGMSVYSQERPPSESSGQGKHRIPDLIFGPLQKDSAQRLGTED